MVVRTSFLEAVEGRNRLIVMSCLAAVIALSWSYILMGAGMDMAAMTMPGMGTPAWSIAHALLMLIMWWMMMVAMMLPSAAPMILLFSALNGKNDGRPMAVTAFVTAYVAVWGGFSLLATATQWGLEQAFALSPQMRATSGVVGGALLIAVGLWQLTPLKHACLRRCRSPIHVLAHGWRLGIRGAFRMGLRHGSFCLGCCWALMALLFYGGVMNLLWIVGLATYVLIEKMVPAGHWIGRGAGLLLVGWGGAVVIRAL
jgi:predicted metal-binding membrane protein